MKRWTGLIVVLMLVVAGCESPKPTDSTPDSGVTNIHNSQLVSPDTGNTDVASDAAPAPVPTPKSDEDTETTP